MATPSESGRVCFVIMPFDARLNRVWDDATVPAVKSAGFDCVRGDAAPGKPGPIMEFVIQQIFSADAIVADLTFSNPNVFYELGIAHAIAVEILADGAAKILVLRRQVIVADNRERHRQQFQSIE